MAEQNTANLEAEIKKCNEECEKCRQDYEKIGAQLNPGSACRYCKNGRKLHELHIQLSPAERQWGRLDWTSSTLEKYYKG